MTQLNLINKVFTEGTFQNLDTRFILTEDFN